MDCIVQQHNSCRGADPTAPRQRFGTGRGAAQRWWHQDDGLGAAPCATPFRSGNAILCVTGAEWCGVVLRWAVAVCVWALACGAAAHSRALSCVPSAANGVSVEGCKAPADTLRTNRSLTNLRLGGMLWVFAVPWLMW